MFVFNRHIPLEINKLDKLIADKSCRKFGVILKSIPIYYLFTEEEIKKLYNILIKHIKYKYKQSDYDYSILVGISNVDAKTVKQKAKANGIGRHKTLLPINGQKGIKYVIGIYTF